MPNIILKPKTKQNIILKKVNEEKIEKEEEEEVEVEVGDSVGQEVEKDLKFILNEEGQGRDILLEAITLNKDSKQGKNKEELLEELEYRRHLMTQNKDQYSSVQYRDRLNAIDRLISRCKTGWMTENIDQMKLIRDRIDRKVIKVPEDQLKKKINMDDGVKRDNQDPHYVTFLKSREYFKDMTYDQYKEFQVKKYNRPVPTEISSKIV